jgi:hypothetical protein
MPSNFRLETPACSNGWSFAVAQGDHGEKGVCISVSSLELHRFFPLVTPMRARHDAGEGGAQVPGEGVRRAADTFETRTLL